MGGGDPARTHLSLNALRTAATGTGGGFAGNGPGGAVTIDLRRATAAIASLSTEGRGIANLGLLGGDGAGARSRSPRRAVR